MWFWNCTLSPGVVTTAPVLPACFGAVRWPPWPSWRQARVFKQSELRSPIVSRISVTLKRAHASRRRLDALQLGLLLGREVGQRRGSAGYHGQRPHGKALAGGDEEEKHQNQKKPEQEDAEGTPPRVAEPPVPVGQLATGTVDPSL